MNAQIQKEADDFRAYCSRKMLPAHERKRLAGGWFTKMATDNPELAPYRAAFLKLIR